MLLCSIPIGKIQLVMQFNRSAITISVNGSIFKKSGLTIDLNIGFEEIVTVSYTHLTLPTKRIV